MKKTAVGRVTLQFFEGNSVGVLFTMTIYSLVVCRDSIMFWWRRSHLYCVHPHVGRGRKDTKVKFSFKLFFLPGKGVPGASLRLGYDADGDAGAGVSLRRAAPLPGVPLHPPRRVDCAQDVRRGGSWPLSWWGTGEGGRGGGDWTPDQDPKVLVTDEAIWLDS